MHTFARLFLEAVQQGARKGVMAGRRLHDWPARSHFQYSGTYGSGKKGTLLTEDDLEAFVKHLTTHGRASSTRNHYVQLIRAMSRWAVKKGYRDTPMVGDDSDVIRRRKEAQRHRRLEPGEEDKLLRSAEPHLQALIVAALETCGRKANC